MLLSGALGDAVCEMQGDFVASSPRLRVGSATQELSYSVAGAIEGGIHGTAKGIGGDEDAHVGYALNNWLHIKRVPWSESMWMSSLREVLRQGMLTSSRRRFHCEPIRRDAARGHRRSRSPDCIGGSEGTLSS
jgi:hypothetical protein